MSGPRGTGAQSAHGAEEEADDPRHPPSGPERPDSRPSDPRRPGPGSDNLYFDHRRQVWYWRKVNERTGKRVYRNTKQRLQRLATREAARFEDELAAEAAGVKTFDEWRLPLAPLVEEWVASLSGADVPPSKATLAQKLRETRRALKQLGLKIASDLTHVARLDDRLRALGRQDVTRITMRRSYQDQLKQFSKWLAANGRYLPIDPLACWTPIKAPREERRSPRRAFLPIEVARAFAALDVLDARNRRVASSRALFTAMLVTAPRVEAMVSRKVLHFDPRASKIDFGESVRNKLRGAGALDRATAEEIARAVEGREAYDPLFLSADGRRWAKERTLDAWREAFSLGIVDALWPEDEPLDLDLALLVNTALLKGRVAVSRGGSRLRPETVERRRELELRVARLVQRLRPDWEERRQGVDVHAFRKTLQTWCEAEGVPGPVIDRQLGHHDPRDHGSMDVLKAIAGSRTGRRSYLDLNSALFDPARAATTMRELLDQAEAQLAAARTLLLDRPADAAPRRSQA